MKTHWTIDSNQSDVLIKMRHSILAYLGSSFNKFQGHVDLRNNEIEDAMIEFSLDVNNKEAIPGLNTCLKLNDFFDINKYPTIRFKSTSFQKVNKNINFLKGDLTIKDVTKTVELDVELIETDYYSDSKKVSFELTADINRRDFGLSYNLFNESSGLSTGQDIKLVANLEFTFEKN